MEWEYEYDVGCVNVEPPLPPQSNEYAQKALALSSGSDRDRIETLLHLLKIMADQNKPAD